MANNANIANNKNHRFVDSHKFVDSYHTLTIINQQIKSIYIKLKSKII